MNYYHSGYGMMGGGYGLLDLIFTILWAALIAAAVIALLRWAARGGALGSRHEGDRSIDILKERYAKGEIDRKEFEEKKKDLA